MQMSVNILRESWVEDDIFFIGLEDRILAILKKISKKWQFYIMTCYNNMDFCCLLWPILFSVMYIISA